MGDVNRAKPSEGDVAVTVQSLVRRVTAVEEENRKLKESVVKMRDENNKFVEEVREDLSRHITMLKILYSNNEYLEGAAMGFDACVAAIKARKTMDDGRFFVVAGFMLIFPRSFPSDSMLLEFDPLKQTVDWQKFLDNLGILYRTYFSGSDVSIQSKSVFRRVNKNTLLYMSQYGAIADTSPLARPTPELRFPDHVNHRMKMTFDVKSVEGKHLGLFTQLKFFVPAFIWAYTELKDILLIDDAVVKQAEAMLEAAVRMQRSELSYDDDDDVDKYIPDRTRLSRGTGASVRHNPAWKEWVKLDVSRSWEDSTYVNRDLILEPPLPLHEPKETDSGKDKAEGENKRKNKPPPFGYPPNFGITDAEGNVSISDEPDAKRRKRNFMAEQASQNVKKQERELAEAIAVRSVHLWRFNHIRKALEILLSDGIIKMALFVTSPVRDVCNFFAHPPGDANPESFDVVNRLPEFSKQCPKPMDEYQAEIYKADMNKLGQCVYNSDKYYDEKRDDLESAVDEYLKQWINFENSPLERPENADARILLTWLEQLQPSA
ncbi:hypothetical protein SCHPADRAFT_896621 [Schizopora paradoxa]|uniref:Uncharacterized protein n=1 Tax=Schizopora paradoxa TaxID=27342 RepID=A0A0H2R6B9_9AGAM|nr:hypothetical protein SCHPADRAFT_896621 [Schizopora paradoxa]